MMSPFYTQRRMAVIEHVAWLLEVMPRSWEVALRQSPLSEASWPTLVRVQDAGRLFDLNLIGTIQAMTDILGINPYEVPLAMDERERMRLQHDRILPEVHIFDHGDGIQLIGGRSLCAASGAGNVGDDHEVDAGNVGDDHEVDSESEDDDDDDDDTSSSATLMLFHVPDEDDDNDDNEDNHGPMTSEALWHAI